MRAEVGQIWKVPDNDPWLYEDINIKEVYIYDTTNNNIYYRKIDSLPEHKIQGGSTRQNFEKYYIYLK